MDIDVQDVIEAIDSEHARELLVLASLEPMSADELGANLPVSLTTVYHHIEELAELELLTEEREITPDGDRYSTYETAVRRIEVTITRGEFHVDIHFRDDIFDGFSRLWRSLEGA